MMTEQEKAARRHQRKAAALNAKAIAEAGMFAAVPGEVKLTTAEEVAERRRRMHVEAADGTKRGTVRYQHTWNQPLEDLQLHMIRGIARAVLGEAYQALADYAESTYPPTFGRMGGHGYHIGFWKDRLTKTEPLVAKWELRFDPSRINRYNSDGRYIAPAVTFPASSDWQPPFTREEIDALVSTLSPKCDDNPTDDDNELFEQVMNRIRS